ncbi:electron transport complex subunit RsxB [Paraburkholderia sp. UYCP14C]|uniref:electron transport complex subunit RsxB n=1 Tax=Paraburkholderia sp. UYCP14C TaxID=2511130 RepID=UPI0010202E98|nr:electron transport complex subunit RsxB [Paraburkholderia sp. UYCP14C]RZF28098.1 electron transport complex subunit RsxB [Paraburkholderia sp. UYCP14C]
MTHVKTLADRIEDLLPQTQCTKCGYPACRPYAEAVASGEANYNQCPPGGAEGIARLATLLGKPVIPLNSANGIERPRPLAVIDEQVCIGCTLCMQACPVDAIVGAPKQMHTVIAELCTGCDLCVPPCPVDCIAMLPMTGEATGWDAWNQSLADAARARHNRHETRLARERDAAEARAAARRAASASVPTAAPGAVPAAGATAPSDISAAPVADDAAAKKRAIIQAALERARQKKEELAAKGQGPLNTENVSADVQAQIDAAEARRHRLGLASGENTRGLEQSSNESSESKPPSNSPPTAR